MGVSNLKLTNGNVRIVEDDKYFRLEFWCNSWKFHSAKMPIEQAEKLKEELIK